MKTYTLMACSALVLGFATGAWAFDPLASTTGGSGYRQPGTANSDANRNANERANGKAESEEVRRIRQEIVIIEEEIVAVKDQIKETEIEDTQGPACDCRASLGVCSSSEYARWGLDPESPKSCEDLWTVGSGKLYKLSRDCRRLVKSCRKVDKIQAKAEARRRLSELQKERTKKRRELSEARSRSRSIDDTYVVHERRGAPCLTCGPSTGELIVAGLYPVANIIGGLTQAWMYNRGLHTASNLYNGYLNNSLQTGIPAVAPQISMPGMGFPGLGVMGFPGMGFNAGIGLNTGWNPGFGPGFGTGWNPGWGVNFGFGQQHYWDVLQQRQWLDSTVGRWGMQG
jgi:hypothetical protein